MIMCFDFCVIRLEAIYPIELVASVVDPLARLRECDTANPGWALEAFGLRFDVHDSGGHDWLSLLNRSKTRSSVDGKKTGIAETDLAGSAPAASVREADFPGSGRAVHKRLGFFACDTWRHWWLPRVQAAPEPMNGAPNGSQSIRTIVPL
jgi:hypothetical protein